MRAVVYYRLPKGASLSVLDLSKKRVQDRGVEVVESYYERGGRLSSPILWEAAAMARLMGIPLVLARVGSLGQSPRYLTLLTYLGVEFECADRPGINSSTVERIIQEISPPDATAPIIPVEYYRDKMSMAVRMGMTSPKQIGDFFNEHDIPTRKRAKKWTTVTARSVKGELERRFGPLGNVRTVEGK